MEKTYDRWDGAGNKYVIHLKGKHYTIGGWKTEYTYVKDQAGKTVYDVSKDHWGVSERLANAENYLKGSAGGWSKERVVVKKEKLDGAIYSAYDAFQAGYKDKYGYTPSGDVGLNEKWLYEYKDLSQIEQSDAIGKMGDTFDYSYWDPEELELTDQGFLEDNPEDQWSKEWYKYEEENNPDWDDVKDTLKVSDDPDKDWELVEESEPLEFETAAYLTQDKIASEMKLWSDIIKEDRPDAFQDALEDAVQDLGWAEEDIINAFNTLQEKFTELETDYTTDVEELIGERIVDPETGEVISEGTYTEGIRLAGKTKTEGLEGTVTTREEELEALREEAGGEIRAAEAKIGAAGFASTGVGKTAREALAGEIGEAAEDIDVEFGEEREIIKEDFVETTGRLGKEKNVSLGDYKRERDRLANEAATGDWKTKTETYQRLLESYDALKGETGSYTLPGVTAPGFATSGGIAAQAETELMGIQSELEAMILGTRTAPGVSDIWDPTTNLWDPFKDPETALYGKEAQFGWDPLAGKFKDEFVSGLFEPTVQEFQYTPGQTDLGALELYDPEYVLPWEDPTAPGGDPTKPGGQG